MAKHVDHTVAIFGTVREAGDTKIRVDPETNALVTIPWEIYLIHGGYLHSIAYSFLDVPKGGLSNMVVAAVGGHLHVTKAMWVATGHCRLRLYGGPTYSGGTYVTPSKMKVGTPGSLLSNFVFGPAVSDLGTYVHTQVMPEGVRHNTADEWILPKDGSVLVSIENVSGKVIDIGVSMVAYEGECNGI